MKSAAVRYWVTLLVLCTVFYFSLKAWNGFRASETRSAADSVAAAGTSRAPTIADLDKTVKPFQLIDQQGQPFESRTTRHETQDLR